MRKKFAKLSVLIDNSDSWFNKYKNNLFNILKKHSKTVILYTKAEDLLVGDVVFILNCTKMLSKDILSLHKCNIVVHASDLPKGKGWSPLAWQVESGNNIISLTLFEASLKCDAGDYYIKDAVRLKGTELIDSIREKVGFKIIEMIETFILKYPLKAIPQKGKESFYRRRTNEDNELDINKTIKSQFNTMRVSDNEKYPAHFKVKDKRYRIKIYEYE